MRGIMEKNDTIKGVIYTSGELKGRINTNNSITAIIDTESISRPNYDGDYTIIPSIIEQTLETNNKVMTDNLNIKQIPYFQTSNQYGDTIYIGKEIDYGN